MPPIAPTSRRLKLATGLAYHLLEWDEPRADHTVVLVHGFLDLARGWVPTVQAGLSARYHVIAPDMRGHGDSDRVGAGGYYYFFDYIADLASLVERLGRDRVSLVGHSMGGSVTSYYAGAFPERVHKLAVLEGLGPPESDTPTPDRVRQWIERWKQIGTTTPRSYATVDDAAARLRETDPRLDPAMALDLAEHGTREGADGRRHFKHDPLHLSAGPFPYRVSLAQEMWSRVTCPVLLVDAAESHWRARTTDLERRAASFQDKRHAILPDAAHMMHRHQPEKLAQLLIDFLE